MPRGTGRTTQQMKDAPLGALFIWCNSQLHYPEQLKRAIERQDLRIRSIRILDRSHDLMGLHRNMVVLDHAAFENMSERQRENWLIWEAQANNR